MNPQCRKILRTSLLGAILFPALGWADIFGGVAPGDGCRDVYAMEIARGAEPGLPLEKMLHEGMLAFQIQDANTRRARLYDCRDNKVTGLVRSIAFHTKAEQRHHLKTLREKVEARFGPPDLDTFNLGFFVNTLMWLEGMTDTVASLQTVYWSLPEGETVSLVLSHRPHQNPGYVVMLNWDKPAPPVKP
ncbi:hypothetical protein ACLD0W_13125 [Alloalcanivorax sp. C16-1]|uniref:hypothetical protein n=1 Tax=Alloalcanivorax sp. C16-1 TaxID=3390051 RepID=UPI003970BF72